MKNARFSGEERAEMYPSTVHFYVNEILKNINGGK